VQLGEMSNKASKAGRKTETTTTKLLFKEERGETQHFFACIHTLLVGYTPMNQTLKDSCRQRQHVGPTTRGEKKTEQDSRNRTWPVSPATLLFSIFRRLYVLVNFCFGWIQSTNFAEYMTSHGMRPSHATEFPAWLIDTRKSVLWYIARTYHGWRGKSDRGKWRVQQI